MDQPDDHAQIPGNPPVIPDPSVLSEVPAYSDESGHLFRFVSDTDPTISDSCRSEATLGREQ